MIRAILIMFTALLLAGCAGFDSDYDKYADTTENHSTQESARIVGQSNAIASAASSAITSTPTESTLLAVIAMMQIQQLQPVPLGMEKPTTWAEVGNTVAGHIPFVATVGGMYKLGEAGIKAAGNIAIGDGSTVSNSLNKPEVHATGSDNIVNYSGTSDPTVVDPVIVEPSYPPVVVTE